LSVYEILALLGIPALAATLARLASRRIAEARRDRGALERGIQALLRAQMISDFNKYGELGYAPIYARENFENCWTQYHALGANGVMDDLHARFMSLPTEPNEQTKGENE